jgi:hypothetical protein
MGKFMYTKRKDSGIVKHQDPDPDPDVRIRNTVFMVSKVFYFQANPNLTPIVIRDLPMAHLPL